jgi:hypothetical protein
MARIEAELTVVIEKSILASLKDAWVYKLPDIPLPNTGKTSAVRFLHKRPFDLLYVHSAPLSFGDLSVEVPSPVAVEVKVHTGHNAFSFSRVDDHQSEALLRFQTPGASAFVFLVIRFSTKKLNAKALSKLPLIPDVRGNICELIAIPPSEYVRVEEQYGRGGSKSIPLADLVAKWGVVPKLEEVVETFEEETRLWDLRDVGRGTPCK